MMLPTTPSNPAQASPDTMPVSPAIPMQADASYPSVHTDYDRHPLTVRHFDHYVEHDDKNERFRVT